MEKTPKLHRKTSLSLSRASHQIKRHSASPQNCLRAAQSVAVDVAAATNKSLEAISQRSPSVVSISSDGGIDCTPPNNKKRSSTNYNNNYLDDSIDYSPKPFDMSFSPSGMLSQTLSINSPEVSWCWTRYPSTATKYSERVGAITKETTTPDSAYAADSSFASASASSTETEGRTRSETHRQRLAYEKRRDDQRKAMELERIRAEKMRADEMLKKRCAKLQEQLNEAAAKITADEKMSQENQVKKTTPPLSNSKSKKAATAVFSSTLSNKTVPFRMCTRQSTASTPLTTPLEVDASASASPTTVADKETLNDFFNDSESDCFLLEATQQLESKITAALTQQTAAPLPPPTTSPCVKVSHTAPAAEPAAVVTTPTSSCKEKRSSFYLQFLEDDSPDDWFVSLDEVIKQATEAKKPRTSFQRYKSMPADTSMTSASAASDGTSATNTKTMKTSMIGNETGTSSSVSKIKRHASSHALSPSSSSYRGRQLHLRK